MILQNISWLTLDRMLRILIGLPVFVCMARTLGPETFGLLNFSLAFIGIFLALTLMGMKDVIVRKLVLSEEKDSVILGSALFLSGIFAVSLYFLLIGFIHFLRPADLQSIAIVSILGACILLKPFEILLFWFEAKVKSKYIVLSKNIPFTILAIFKIYLLINGVSIFWIVCLYVCEAVAVALISIYFFHSRSLKIQQLKARKDQIILLLRESWPILFSSAAIILYMRLDQVMLGQLSSDSEVGIYSAAVRITETWYLVPAILVTAIFPKIIEFKTTNQESYQMWFQSLLDMLLIFSLPAIIFCWLFGEELILLMFGAEFMPAASVLVIHICASIPVAFGVASARWLITEGMQKIILIKTIFICAANVSLNFLFIPEYGAVGAALATALCQGFGALLLDWFFVGTRELLRMKYRSLNIIAAGKRLVASRSLILKLGDKNSEQTYGG